jgi:hypothetical protein
VTTVTAEASPGPEWVEIVSTPVVEPEPAVLEPVAEPTVEAADEPTEEPS